MRIIQPSDGREALGKATEVGNVGKEGLVDLLEYENSHLWLSSLAEEVER